MYLLYLDESGNEDNPDDRYFVLGGVAVFERVTFFLSRELDTLNTTSFPGLPSVPFHTTKIRSGTGFWRRVPETKRAEILERLGETIANSNHPGVVLFAVAVEKTDQIYGEAAVKRATEEICRRFDIFLRRRSEEHGDTQRGLLIFSEGRFDKRAKIWVKGFWTLGTQWGTITKLSDIPYFAPTAESRLLQVADHVAHAVFLLYENRNPALVRKLLSRFDAKDGTIHGLVHVTPSRNTCGCPACSSRTSPNDLGTWVR